MKFKTTKKEILENRDNNKIFAIGYCHFQELLTFYDPIAYIATESFGWKCDIYFVGNYTIVCGYSTFGIPEDYKLAYSCEVDAKKINSSALSNEDKKQLLDNLLQSYFNYALRGKIWKRFSK